MVLFIILLIVLLYLWHKFCAPNSRMKELGDKLPGPRPIPVLGNGLAFLTSKTLVKALDDLCQSYGPVMRLWLGSKLWICLCDPEDIGAFLNSSTHLNKSDLLRLLDSWLGTKGLVTGDADVWRVHRKKLTPSFHFDILRDSLNIIRTNAKILCNQMKAEMERPEFDIMEYIEKCSLDIIGETAMGIKLNTQTVRYSVYLESLKQVKKSTIRRLFQAWLHPEIIFRMSRYGKLYYEKLGIIKSEVQKIIMDRRRFLKDKMTDNHSEGVEKNKIFLDFMLTQGDFTDEEIENEVETFMFAGQDTIVATLSFCLFELSQHSDIQDRCYNEIINVIGENLENTNVQDFKNLKYLENVINETLRLYTPVPLIARKVEEDIRLPSNYVLPAGSAVNFNLLALHRNKKYFPKAEEFIPERFDDRDMYSQGFNFVPFSAGPRNCLGQKFAMLEMKVVLSVILLHYRLLPSEHVKELTLETGIVLQSLENFPVRITTRNIRATY
ncbi:hypothetical protein V9T40_003327 [Parthenolecanium corni]|uniref:Cytochrome P450 n=1 Tax=Parthenolecanium corni TaxID=536013 RepID=A0AAN9TSJ4_9HEMI